MEARLDGPLRQPKAGGDIGNGEVQVEPQDQDGSLFGREPTEAALELFTIHDRVERSVRCRLKPMAGVCRLPPPALSRTAADEEPMNPRVVLPRITEPGEASPCLDERVLHGIACRLRPADHESGNPVQAAEISRGELREGVVVSTPGALDEISPVHLLLGYSRVVL